MSHVYVLLSIYLPFFISRFYLVFICISVISLYIYLFDYLSMRLSIFPKIFVDFK